MSGIASEMLRVAQLPLVERPRLECTNYKGTERHWLFSFKKSQKIFYKHLSHKYYNIIDSDMSIVEL